MIDFLLNPWVICIIIVSFLIGNIAAMKYTTIKFGQMNQKKSDLDKLNKLNELNERYQNKQKKDTD